MINSLPHTPSFSLEGRRALVTGASRGIGLGLSTALAQSGAHVTLVARNKEDVTLAANAIKAEGFLAEAVSLDVSNYEDVQRFCSNQPPFHILINNAGTNRPKSILDLDLEDYDAVLDLNLKSTIFMTKEIAKHMIQANISGSLIHIGSQMGHVGSANRTLYCASKWAIEGFNKALAVELAEYGIRSNTICPTFIETPMTQPFLEDEHFRTHVLSKIKLGRLGQIEDLMGAAVFLASDASSMMTGSSMLIDGGWTAD
ncbi:SDR family NAD(P)-dependent oxidoreductase [Marinomonas mediterranea]|jgi:Dehydrogenases with different specificities (related to short-chain alcohol dehydrogenases)|uniref:3-oxoacyl-(Acyl-carrier-protein) reductase n=1 Tax=Marinomonas mediterranea (strain ATCC 700492 / JCM 21426 / NBRC 103028 / MMB-1) TaxID=717774 RepID=F2K2E6_MARM1|nr:SDR family NAD(P)-dependent oxidoreductase [Marinomonas mediterranea]ADZ92326.1 3-oxoacyl-(acyl-carrier-protein) reductase [Marinomonas mediterranea MMB-1]WCN10278.1 SDR family oxidoreductase [Marinomonas mediterranea]WCN14325.1 SDR family oxidoreductase [Marinomonas mediterranea]WCN18377.1 SDR family oxidoreductase [Marinomonas mediterranea MMB-1]